MDLSAQLSMSELRWCQMGAAVARTEGVMAMDSLRLRLSTLFARISISNQCYGAVWHHR